MSKIDKYCSHCPSDGITIAYVRPCASLPPHGILRLCAGMCVHLRYVYACEWCFMSLSLSVSLSDYCSFSYYSAFYKSRRCARIILNNHHLHTYTCSTKPSILNKNITNNILCGKTEHCSNIINFF